MAERVTSVLTPDLPGTCLLRVRDSARPWHLVHDTYAFELMLRAERPTEGRYGSRRFRTVPGTLIHLHPGEAQIAQLSSPTSAETLFVDPAEVRKSIDPDGYGPEVVVFDAIQTARPSVLKAFRRMVESMVAPDPSALERQTCLTAALGALFTPIRSLRRPESPPDRTRAVRRILALLNDRLSERVTLEDLEGETGLDRFRLLRAFRLQTGMPPHAYHLALRLAKARRLLQTGAPPAEVAAACGFSDQSHLIRRFRRHFGMTPGLFISGGPPAGGDRRNSLKPPRRTR